MNEKRLIANDINTLSNQLNEIQESFARCINEKYQLVNDLSTCQSSLDNKIENKVDSKTVNKIDSKIISSIDNKIDNKIVSKIDNNINLSNRWLVVGIPTVSRPNNENYLLTSLEKLSNQLPDNTDYSHLLYNKILIVIVNVDSKQHDIFDEAIKLYTNSIKSNNFLFLTLQSNDLLFDPKEGSNELNDQGNANIPGYRVRKQTRNIVNVILKSYEYGKYYLFLEDDMELCFNGFYVLQYMIDKSNRYHNNWLAIRTSYGMNGIIMHSKDMKVFADYLIRNQQRRPPDHLVVEWYAGETIESKEYKQNRANIGFRYNIFNHIGYVSSLRSQRQTTYPLCYDELFVPTVFEVEAFNPRACPRDDIWPCDVNNADNGYVQWNMYKHFN